jgi:DNA-binding GntR family transcriptional regulator
MPGETSTVAGAVGQSTLQRHDPRPLHVQISDWLRAFVLTGAWPPHHRLPPEHELSELLGVARGTLKRGLKTLVDEGMLVQVQGRGTFVTSGGLGRTVEHDRLSLAEALRVQGLTVSTTVESHELVEARADIAVHLSLPAGAQVFRLVRVRHADGVPVAYFVNYIRTDICPDFTNDELTHESLYALIESACGARVASGRRRLEARAADADLAELLETPVGTPLQYFEQVTYLEDGRPVEFSEVWIRSDRVKLQFIVGEQSILGS